MAGPRDTLVIRDKEIKVNGDVLREPSSVKKDYNIWSSDLKRLNDLDKSGRSLTRRGTNFITIPLTIYQKDLYEEYEFIDSLSLNILTKDSTRRLYPYSDLFTWSIDNYGPFVVPFKGMRIKLDNLYYNLYNNAICSFETNTIDSAQIKSLLNDTTSTYVFNNDYYFFLGDNRDYSDDSRMWGIVSEHNIVGKAEYVVWSKAGKGFNRERFLMKIE